MNRPRPPEDFDENPALDADFFARARPAAPGEVARLRKALAQTLLALKEADGDKAAIAEAQKILTETQL